MITGAKTKILGTSTYLYTMSIYDDKGRPIQLKSTNSTGGTDVITTQYGWQGLPLTIVKTQWLVSVGGAGIALGATEELIKTTTKFSNTAFKDSDAAASLGKTASTLGKVKKLRRC